MQGSLGNHQMASEPAPLNLRRQIFLSHSGKDKNFVQFLYNELSKCYQYANIAFFDKETLPTGVRVCMDNILLEARQSKLGVIVLTEDFFVHTPNPMRELAEFVAYNVPLLPLFFTMSVDEFKQKKGMWKEQWIQKWPNIDSKVMDVWIDALNHVPIFCGLEYSKIATTAPDYIRKIVKEVTRIVTPAIPLSAKGVYGMDRLCKIVNDMYMECALKRSSNDRTSTSTAVTSSLSDLVGIYGFAGLGKTTLCKGLCDFYFGEYGGKVCYVDLGSKPSTQASSLTHSSNASSLTHSSNAVQKRVEHVLATLTSYTGDYQHLELSQVQNLLIEQISLQTDPVFLAIDDVTPDLHSKNEADFYLRCEPFPRGSKIFITSRSCKILENLASPYSSFSLVIESIPELKLEEAKSIFEHKLHNFHGKPNLEDQVNECVNMCIIHEEQFKFKHYHPLMLNSLATAIRWDTMGDLNCKLVELRSKADKNGTAMQTVFSVLDITYEGLNEESKKVLLDLVLFYNFTRNPYETHAWIQNVYSHFDSNKILSHLEDVSFISMRRNTSIQVHDLIVDFSKYKILQGANKFPRSQSIAHDYLVLENSTHWNDQVPRSARSVTISRCEFDNPTLDLRNVEGLEVLHLVGNVGLQEVLLSPSTCAHIRSLIVTVLPGISLCFTIVVDKLDSTSAACQRHIHTGREMGTGNGGSLQRSKMITPPSLGLKLAIPCDYGQQTSWMKYHGGLKWVHLEGNISTQSNVTPVFDLGALGDLRNLEVLTLTELPVETIDVKSCANVKYFHVYNLPRLTSIRGLENLKILESLKILKCKELLALTIPADNHRLRSTIKWCGFLERLILHTTLSPAAIATYSLGEAFPFSYFWTLTSFNSYYINAEADCSCTGSHGDLVVGNHSTSDQKLLDIYFCKNLKNIDGISQYIGKFQLQYAGKVHLEESFQDLLELAEVDSSICKARVTELNFCRYDYTPAGLIAGVKVMRLEECQHIGPLISALFKAQPKHLKILGILCKRGGCGCDKNAPLFGPLPNSQVYKLKYCCSQVTDVSSLSQWDKLTSLDLSGCTSVELWPDFATMTALENLRLRYCTSLEWLVLPSTLISLQMRGCTQLPAEEFMKVITLKMQPRPNRRCILAVISSLRDDLKDQTRDSCSIVDALDSYLPDLGARFHDAWHAVAGASWNHDRDADIEEYCIQIELMYALLFEERNIPSEGNWLSHMVLDEITELLHNIGWYKASRWYKASLSCMQCAPKDRTIKLVKSFFEAPSFSTKFHRSSYQSTDRYVERKVLRYEMLAMHVAYAMYTFAREPSVATELGEGFMCHNIIQDLAARVQQDYDICKARFSSFEQVY